MAKFSCCVPMKHRMSQLVKKPDASINDFFFKEFKHEGVIFMANVSVNNPYCIAIPIYEISFSLKFGRSGEKVANGRMPYSKSLEGKKKTTFEVAIEVKYTIFKELFNDVAADWDIDCHLDLELNINLPAIRNIPIRLHFDKEIKLDVQTLLSQLAMAF